LPHVLASPSSYKSKAFLNSKGNAECVEFIQQTLSAPVTASWSEGIKIVKLGAGQTDPVAVGTAIATFVNGKYPQTGSTGKHAAIYLGQDATGIQVLDQWRAQGKVLQRTIRWTPSKTGLSNDGNAFSVIEW
jgi:hypothetical protein